MKDYIAMIQAGGRGTRMRGLTHDRLPKPLLALNDKPLLEWQIHSLSQYGVDKFIIIIGHLGYMIKDYFGDGRKWGVRISYIEETRPLGSAGALYFAKEIMMGTDVIFIFGDVMFELDWDRFISFHEEHEGIVTLLAHPNDHPYDSDLLIVDETDAVIGIDRKNRVRGYEYRNLVNAGLSIFKSELLDGLKEAGRLDYESGLVKPLMDSHKVFAYNTPEYVKDVGTPDRFQKACEEQRRGIWSERCLKHRQKAVVIDRDDIINAREERQKSSKEPALLPGAAEAVKRINASGYLAIIASEKASPVEWQRICMEIETLLGRQGAYVNDISDCPYLPYTGYYGRYNINVADSWYVGSDERKRRKMSASGMQTIQLETDGTRTGPAPDALLKAVDRILLSNA